MTHGDPSIAMDGHERSSSDSFDGNDQLISTYDFEAVIKDMEKWWLHCFWCIPIYR